MTMVVTLGTNTFIDCETIFAVKGNPLLQIKTNPLRITFVTPPDLPSGRIVRVVDNVDQAPAVVHSSTRVVASDQSGRCQQAGNGGEGCEKGASDHWSPADMIAALGAD